MKRERKVKATPSPVFIAQFADGQVTRMTAHCENGELDLEHGIAVACAAYESRAGKPPPPIVAAKFVEPGYDDTVLQEYDAAVLQEAAGVLEAEQTVPQQTGQATDEVVSPEAAGDAVSPGVPDNHPEPTPLY